MIIGFDSAGHRRVFGVSEEDARIAAGEYVRRRPDTGPLSHWWFKEDVPGILTRALAMPKTHKVVTTYADGRVREHLTRSLAAAETHAVGERRKIGRDLIEHFTGKIVRVVSVEIGEV